MVMLGRQHPLPNLYSDIREVTHHRIHTTSPSLLGTSSTSAKHVNIVLCFCRGKILKFFSKMSLLGRVFGHSKKKKDTDGSGEKDGSKKGQSPAEALVKLRETEDMLTKKSDFLEKKISDSHGSAKKHASQRNKRSAIQALKRKKMYEKHQKEIDQTLFSIEYQRIALENATTNKEVIGVLSGASKAMKKAQKNVSIDEVNRLMDDMAEHREFSNEVHDALSHPITQSNEFDEDELWDEFVDESNDNRKARPTSFKLRSDQPVPAEMNLPSPPSLDPTPSTAHYKRKAPKPKPKSRDDDEIEKLAAWAT